jgi:hypothetical protein
MKQTPHAVKSSDKGKSNVIWYPYAALIPTRKVKVALQWLNNSVEEPASLQTSERKRLVFQAQALFA